MSLPERNARVVKVAGGGASEDYDYEGGAAPTRWEGDEDAYVVETVVEETGAADTEKQKTRLVVGLDVGRYVKLGDQVTYVYEGEQATRTVRTVVKALIAGETSLTFEDV